MSYLINGDTLHDTITIDKQSGTVVTFGTGEKYVEKNIMLTLNVQSGSASTPATTITVNPIITMSDSGLITATASASSSVTPSVSSGYVTAGTSGTVSVNGSNTYQIPVATVSETKAYLGIN